MLRDRYDPYSLFDAVPQLGLRFEPELAELDRLLDDDALFGAVRAEMARRAPHSLTRGRRSTPVEVVLRMLVVRRLYDWSYEETERFVGDSLVLRQFCRLGLAPAPDDTTLIRWAGLVRPAALDALHGRVVALARGLRVTRGRKLRTDGTVVATTMHHPGDSSLLADGVRVLSRLVGRARALVGAAAGDLCRDRTRSAKWLARRIGAAAARGGERTVAERRRLYGRLLGVARASLRQADRVSDLLAEVPGAAAARLRAGLARFVPLTARAVAQTERRVVRGEAVPAADKVVSLFEPHTAVVRRGKAGQPTEFGRKVWLDEVDGGVLSRYAVLAGNPPDAAQVAPALAQHRRLFGRPPDLLAADRGAHSPENERLARAAGVRRVCLPQPGHRTPDRRALERQRWFRRARRFRAGAEGRISVCKRRGWLGRCRDKGADGFARWVGWGVIAANLTTIARTVAARA
jgi:IS5 family transposase